MRHNNSKLPNCRTACEFEPQLLPNSSIEGGVCQNTDRKMFIWASDSSRSQANVLWLVGSPLDTLFLSYKWGSKRPSDLNTALTPLVCLSKKSGKVVSFFFFYILNELHDLS